MSMQVNRFQAIGIDRVDKTTIAIIDHRSDERIIHIRVSNEEDNKKIAESFIPVLENLIENKEINYE